LIYKINNSNVSTDKEIIILNMQDDTLFHLLKCCLTNTKTAISLSNWIFTSHKKLIIIIALN